MGGAAEGDVRRALAAVSGELEAMLAKGQGGRFGGSATPSEMRTFNANVARLERERQTPGGGDGGWRARGVPHCSSCNRHCLDVWCQ